MTTPTDLVLGTLGIAALAVLTPPLWSWLRQYLQVVRSAQALDIGGWQKVLGRWLFLVVVLSAPSWVAVLMVQRLVNGTDPMRILLGALIVNAALTGAWRRKKAYAVAATPVSVMYYLILYAGPLSQAGAVALAAWFLLIGGVRWAYEVLILVWALPWRSNALLGRVPVSPRVWSPVFLAFAVLCLVVGARMLLEWDYGPAYGQSFG